MSLMEIRQEVNTFIQASFGARCKVVFGRSEHISIPKEMEGAMNVYWGNAEAVNQSAMLCPTTHLDTVMVDIFAPDRERTMKLFDDLKEACADYEPKQFSFVRFDAASAYEENTQTDGLRAVIVCQYIN